MTIAEWIIFAGLVLPLVANVAIFILRKAGKNAWADEVVRLAPLVMKWLARNPEKIEAAAEAISASKGAKDIAVRLAGLKLEEAMPESKAPKSSGVPPVVLPLFVLVACVTVLCGCSPAQHPCVNAYDKAETPEQIAEADAICGHMLLTGSSSSGTGGAP